MIKIFTLCGILALSLNSISAYTIVEEDKAWNSCLKIKVDKDKKICMIKFEKKFYPYSIYDDEELNWSDIDWSGNS